MHTLRGEEIGKIKDDVYLQGGKRAMEIVGTQMNSHKIFPPPEGLGEIILVCHNLQTEKPGNLNIKCLCLFKTVFPFYL